MPGPRHGTADELGWAEPDGAAGCCGWPGLGGVRPPPPGPWVGSGAPGEADVDGVGWGSFCWLSPPKRRLTPPTKLFQPSTSALPVPVWAGSGDADADGAASGFLTGSGFEPGNG